MKWHDYPVAWRSLAKPYGGTFEGLWQKMDLLIRRGNLDHPTRIAMVNSLAHLTGEHRWELAKKPYYDVYPSVVEALTKVDLDKIMCDHIHLPLDDLMIRFQTGHELKTSERTIYSMLVSETRWRKNEDMRGILIAVNDGELVEGQPNHSTTALILVPGTTIQSQLDIGREPGHSLDQGVDNESMSLAFQFVCSLCLLKDNPDLINQEPLEADRAKWERTHDITLIEKAGRRGKRCWSVGRHIEVAPGFRRPHFAIRWMGHGEPKQPILRPISGCLVHRQRITEVPTGYLDKPLEAILLED